MIKLANFLSVLFHPLFITFFNFLFFIFLTDATGPTLGFIITLFFLAVVLIPVFYTFAIIYTDNKYFEWSHLSNMAMLSRRKLLVYTIIYNVVFLLFLLSINEVFLGRFKPMFASVIMGFVLSMMIAFILHLKNFKNSLHALTIAFFGCFNLIFAWRVPGLENTLHNLNTYFLIAGVINMVLLVLVAWARLYLKAHNTKEIVVGILIGILSPLLLTLLAYGL